MDTDNNISDQAQPSREEEEEERVTINVGGTLYSVASSTIMKYPQTMLGAMLSTRWEQTGKEREIYIDRDGSRFKYILDYYRDGTVTIPLTMSKSEMMREVDYFALSLSENDIQFDACEIVALRESVARFENTLVETFQEQARQRSVVACAYEIAALLIKKMRANPDMESIQLFKNEVPTTSFAHVLCADVLNDPIFQETIPGLVQQAGYHFVGEITSDHFFLSRAIQFSTTQHHDT